MALVPYCISSNEKPLKRGYYTDEEFKLRQSLLSGSGFSGGKQRIYEYFISHASMTDRSAFLKKEYGIGGGTVSFSDNTRGHSMHSGKGYELQIETFSVLYSWNKIAEYIAQMIEDGEYYCDKAYTRCFSRRISEKTGWYCENTDSLPQLRGLCIPALKDTVIDGEMYIPDRPFKMYQVL